MKKKKLKFQTIQKYRQKKARVWHGGGGGDFAIFLAFFFIFLF